MPKTPLRLKKGVMPVSSIAMPQMGPGFHLHTQHADGAGAWHVQHAARGAGKCAAHAACGVGRHAARCPCTRARLEGGMHAHTMLTPPLLPCCVRAARDQQGRAGARSVQQQQEEEVTEMMGGLGTCWLVQCLWPPRLATACDMQPCFGAVHGRGSCCTASASHAEPS